MIYGWFVVVKGFDGDCCKNIRISAKILYKLETTDEYIVEISRETAKHPKSDTSGVLLLIPNLRLLH